MKKSSVLVIDDNAQVWENFKPLYASRGVNIDIKPISIFDFSDEFISQYLAVIVHEGLVAQIRV